MQCRKCGRQITNFNATHCPSCGSFLYEDLQAELDGKDINSQEQIQDNQYVMQSQPKKPRKVGKVIFRIFIFLILAGGALYALWYFGYLDKFLPWQFLPWQQEMATGDYYHTMPVENIGVNLGKRGGNGADVTIEFLEKLHEKYSGQKPEETIFDGEDQNYLIAIAQRKYFSIYPEHISIPKSPLDLLEIDIDPKANLNFVTKLNSVPKSIIATSKKLESEGKLIEAEKILKSGLVISRRLEDMPFNTTIFYLVGASMESQISPELKNFYSRNQKEKDLILITDYFNEGTAMISEFRKSISQTIDIFKPAVCIFLVNQKNANFPSVDSCYLATKTSANELSENLEFLKSTSNKILKIESLFPLIFIASSSNVQSESRAAKDVLTEYIKDSNKNISKLAENALETTAGEIVRLLGGSSRVGELWKALNTTQ